MMHRVSRSIRYGINGTFKDEGVAYGLGAGYDFALNNGASLGVDVEASDRR